LLSVGVAAAPLLVAVCLMLPDRHAPAIAQSTPHVNAIPAQSPEKPPAENTVALAAVKPLPPSVEIITTPPGVPFHILPAEAGNASSEAVETGRSPANLDGLQPGSYQLILGGGRWPSRSLPFQVEEAGKTTLVRDLPHGIVRIESQPPGAMIYEGNVFLGIAPVSIPTSPGRHVFVAAVEGDKTVSRTVDMAADQTKDIRFDVKAITPSRTGREVARRRHRPKKHAEEPMLAKIGRSIKEGLIKAEAVMFPHPGKDRRLWD
jgi:hypothetical protein